MYKKDRDIFETHLVNRNSTFPWQYSNTYRKKKYRNYFFLNEVSLTAFPCFRHFEAVG